MFLLISERGYPNLDIKRFSKQPQLILKLQNLLLQNLFLLLILLNNDQFPITFDMLFQNGMRVQHDSDVVSEYYAFLAVFFGTLVEFLGQLAVELPHAWHF